MIVRLHVLQLTFFLISSILSADPLSIYFVNSSGMPGVNRVNSDRSGFTTLIDSTEPPRDIAIDTSSNKLYFTDSNSRIFSANLDGTNLVDITPDRAPAYAYDFELSAKSGIAFYAATRSIDSFNVNTHSWTEIVKLDFPAQLEGGLALNEYAQHVYFMMGASSPTGTDKIMRVNFDGTGLVTVLDLGVEGSDVGDIEVDPFSGKLYWTDQRTQKIWRANLDGTGRETLVDDWGRKLELDLIYWGSPVGGGLYRADLDGFNRELVVSSPPDDIFGIDFGPSASQTVPEPSLTFLLGLGLIGVCILHRRKLVSDTL